MKTDPSCDSDSGPTSAICQDAMDTVNLTAVV